MPRKTTKIEPAVRALEVREIEIPPAVQAAISDNLERGKADVQTSVPVEPPPMTGKEFCEKAFCFWAFLCCAVAGLTVFFTLGIGSLIWLGWLRNFLTR